MSSLTIESLNCRGLRDQKKKMDILDDFRSRNINIVHLQETHLTHADLPFLKKIWNCKFIIAGVQRQALGVITIINNNFEYKLHNVIKDKGGRYILCDIELPGIARFLMLNIYGQNYDKPEFLITVLNLLEQNFIRNWVLCGDWNLVLDQQKDTHNYLKHNNPKSSKVLLEFIEKYGLIDAWRLKYPDKKKYTWFKPSPVKAARLDYFLISTTILDILSDCYISFKYRSDHCKIGLKIYLDKSNRGKGIWKLNSELLADTKLMKTIEEGILLMVEVHACTPYNPEFVKLYFIHEISLMTNIDVFWEVLLSHLRGIFISHAAKKKRERCNREQMLIKNIEEMNDLYNLDITDENLEEDLQNMKIELEDLRDFKLKGSFVRSRIKEHIEGEKPNKNFLNLENYNFISKNIKELLLDDGTKITEPQDILEEMRRFYQSLYNFKLIKPIENSELAEFPSYFNKLNEIEKMSLDNQISEDELKGIVFGSGLNKSPGPDGYTNEFYRSLWSKLGILLLSLMNFFLNETNISQNHLMGIITCIPKGDKLRNKLKNWRPITLLNSIYKFYSGIWANRIKKYLPKLIGDSQTGFVMNRFIGENTRLTLDILNESKFENTDGLLILVDFEKAFDSISWDFISKILKLFNFSEKTIQIIKSLQKNSFSKIVQNGHSSDLIRLGRGCRQGDPISPYIFVLAVELLGVSVRTHKQLKGYKIKGKEHRISQFADDTNLFLFHSERNLRLCMDILEEFHLISGLKINVDKTKVVKFGKNRDSSDTLCPDLKLIWTDTFTSLGITYDMTDLENITNLNIEPKILEMNKQIRIWQTRNLTLIGKILIIKSLLISKIIHILLSLPSPTETLFIKIESLFELFLWNGKPPKFKKQILEKTIADGGLQYPNIRHVDATMKASWFKRIYKSTGDWVSIPHIYKLEGVYMYGDIYQQQLLNTVKNVFWRDTIKALILINMQQTFHGKESLLATPIWYNSQLIPEKRYTWVNKCITTIGDILDNQGNIWSIEEIFQKWKIKCDFLLHLSLKKRIQNLLLNQNMENIHVSPQLPYVLHCLEIGNKGNKNVYYNSLKRDSLQLVDLSEKWGEAMNEDFNVKRLNLSFEMAKKSAPSVYQQFIQYKLLHRRTITNRLLKKMNITDFDHCLYCKESPETIEHIYLECTNSKTLWQETIKWVRSIYDNHFIISDSEKIFGGTKNSLITNTIITSVKDVIYFKRKTGTKMHITDVKRCLLKNLSTLKTKELAVGNLLGFENRWDSFITDLKNDNRINGSCYITVL